MSFFARLSKGWEISKLSLKVLQANKSLILFPLLSGISLMVIIASFFLAVFASFGWNFSNMESTNRLYAYGLTFIVYLINYTVVVFFNMALIHCTKLYFQGEEVSISKGIQFSLSRIKSILSWAVFAATIGLLLKAIQNNLGTVGKIITGLIGIVWSVATFFTVPILAYENVTPLQALKKSGNMMRDQWGESLGATFSFGLMQFVAFILVLIPAFAIGYFAPIVGIGIGILGFILIAALSSALNSIFVSVVYNKINGDTNMHLKDEMFDSLFLPK